MPLNNTEKQLFDAIRKAICEDTRGLFLKQPQIKEMSSNPYVGYCYVASEAFMHMIKRDGYKSMFLNLPEELDSLYRTHWFVQSPSGDIIDLTAEQFGFEPPYHLAKGKGFLTKGPSKRAVELIKAANHFRNSLP